MKRVYIVLLIVSQLLLSGCGGKEGGDNQEPTTSNNIELEKETSDSLDTTSTDIEIEVFNENEDKNIVVESCSNYTKIFDGDLLFKEDIDTTVRVIHSSDNSKDICVISGKAYIKRA